MRGPFQIDNFADNANEMSTPLSMRFTPCKPPVGMIAVVAVLPREMLQQ
jgi:hypothetical protein